MTKDDFVDYLLYEFNYTRTRKRVYWQFYSITPKAVKMFDRRKHEKIMVKRTGKTLYCMSCKKEKCDHTLFVLNDKEVKKSLDIAYIHKISRVFYGVDFVTGDYEAETW
jgi:hypothetical protein